MEKNEKKQNGCLITLLTIAIFAFFLITLAFIIVLIRNNTTKGYDEIPLLYDGDTLLFFIVFIALAIISLIILIIKICKFKNSHSKFGIILSSLFLAYCIGGITLIGVGRKAKNNDIYIDLDQKISLNMDFNVHSYENINDLEVTFVFRNKDGAIISTKVKTIGDVKRNKNYVVIIKFTEFTITEIMKIERISAYVSDGRTSYI